MAILARLKAIARRILRRAQREPQFVPQYCAARVMCAIHFPSRGASYSLTHSMDASRRSGSCDDSLFALVRYFRTRDFPRFFYDAGALVQDRSACGHEARRWLEAACRDAHRWTEGGLPVYHLTAPALAPGFAWGGEWCRGQDDVLFAVRPHRFGFAPRLALATVGGSYSATCFVALLRDWMAFATRNPQLPFISNLVVTQRLLASTCAFNFLRATEESGEEDAQEASALLLQIIAEDVGFLLPRLGDSYPNNHLLIDRFAAWLIATVFPEFSHGKLDPERTEREWLAELERQTYDDGGSFEHSVHYHGLAAEAAAAWLVLKRANGSEVSRRHAERVERMLRLQADLAGPDGHAPAIGNGTEDPLFPLDGGDGSTSAALREVYRTLFATSRPALDSDHPERERAFWLLGGEIAGPAGTEGAACASHYEQGGFHVFFEHGESTRCVFRTGPVAGTSTTSGHMHADLMNVYWIHRGAPVLVDPGTWSYCFRASHAAMPDASLRAYLCGPEAHNGVVIDGIDPLGVLNGDFRSGPAMAHVAHDAIATGKRVAFVQARMTAPKPYSGFVRGVVHVREEYFVVYSRIPQDAGGKDVYFPLQFDPKVRIVSKQAGVVALSIDNGSPAGLVFSRGDASSAGIPGSADVSGWVSPHYGELIRAPRLCFRPEGEEQLSAFALSADRVATIIALDVIPSSARSAVFKVSGVDFCDYLIVNPTGERVELSRDDIEFEGLLLWVRDRRDGSSEVRSLGLKSLRSARRKIAREYSSAQAEFSQNC